MTTELIERPEAAPADRGAAIVERVVLAGDLARLTAEERVRYYAEVCRSLGLNPLTRPFDYITLNGKLTLYASRGATDQLRSLKGISVERLDSETVEGVYVVTAYGRDAQGRTDSSKGAVPIAGLKGNDLANALMKAETKAKRRLTLSLAGLGWLDETEVGTVADAVAVRVDAAGEIVTEAPRTLGEALAAAKAAEVEAPAAAEDVAAAPLPAAKESMTLTELGAFCKARGIPKAFVKDVTERLGLDPRHLTPAQCGQIAKELANLDEPVPAAQ